MAGHDPSPFGFNDFPQMFLERYAKRIGCALIAFDQIVREFEQYVGHGLSLPQTETRANRKSAHRIVGIENSAPSLMPVGQREVTVFVFV
jgi:hypothetical protein